MDEIFIALEGLFDLIGEFILDRAFDKKKALKKITLYNCLYFNTNINYFMFNCRWYLFGQRQ